MTAILDSPAWPNRPRSLAGRRSVQTFCCIFLFVLGVFIWTQPSSVRVGESLGKLSEKVKNLKESPPEATPVVDKPPEPVQDPIYAANVHLPPPDEEEYAAFCMVIKNQSIDMPEFFRHHYYHHGIRRFYIYDDGSEPPLSEHPYINDYGIPDKHITFRYIQPEDVEDRFHFQVDTYTDCVERFGAKHKWMAFLDPDEFLEMRGANPPTLIKWLKTWEQNSTVGALGVHWLGHNSGGHLKKQPGDVRKAFTTCIGNDPTKSNKHVKTFVRPDRFYYIENIHWSKTKDGTIEVAEHGDLIHTWMHTPVSHDIWALHHYATKSREDYELKKSRHR